MSKFYDVVEWYLKQHVYAQERGTFKGILKRNDIDKSIDLLKDPFNFKKLTLLK